MYRVLIMKRHSKLLNPRKLPIIIASHSFIKFSKIKVNFDFFEKLNSNQGELWFRKKIKFKNGKVNSDTLLYSEYYALYIFFEVWWHVWTIAFLLSSHPRVTHGHYTFLSLFSSFHSFSITFFLCFIQRSFSLNRCFLV